MHLRMARSMLLSERLPIVIVVSADMLRLEKLRNEMRDVSAAAARHQRRARAARGGCSMRWADCALEGFWLPLTVEIASLPEAEGGEARDRVSVRRFGDVSVERRFCGPKCQDSLARL